MISRFQGFKSRMLLRGGSVTTLMALWLSAMAHAQPTTVITIQPKTKPISSTLFGVFFEDLNYAADGGLYAEMIQNRSFEYTPGDAKDWNSLTSWTWVERDGAQGKLMVDSAQPLNSRNPHYAVIECTSNQGRVGLANTGFDGILVQAGSTYDFSLFARTLSPGTGTLVVRLEDETGAPLAESSIDGMTSPWSRHTAELKPSQSSAHARLVLLTGTPGRMAIDVVSLFPRNTFRNRKNGLRADLAQAIADLQPKFVRFPGGCLVHGDGLANMYRWKNTIGPIEQRIEQRNLWKYHQTAGLGYFEYFQFCEDIGAKPVPVVAAGVSCQNTNAPHRNQWGEGQQAIPLTAMDDYIQEVLDLVEYANGPVTSKWGAQRAADGHPAPFHLEYIGIGNEDSQTEAFRKRFKQIHDAVRAKHPEITVIGTTGPFAAGTDYENGWAFANREHVAMVDEHYYEPPQWFLDHLDRYDHYDRSRSAVYVGEYAAHDEQRRSTLRLAVIEAAYLTHLERNGDVVKMSSYAPLLAKLNHINWRPDLIYFDNGNVFPTVNYYVQQLFSRNSGDEYLDSTQVHPNPALAVSTVRHRATGDLIVKLVNTGSTVIPVQLRLPAALPVGTESTLTLLTGAPEAVNEPGLPATVRPRVSALRVEQSTSYSAPPYSVSVIRMTTRH